MKLFLAFLVALMQVTPTFAAQRILSADKIEGIVTQKEFVGSKGHFEKNVAGVSAYADLAGTSPVDGSGGSPNTACTRTTSSPISGDGSLLITKSSGASRQGEGCAMAFTTDANHYGRVLTISADYIVGSGTFTAGSSSTDSDVVVWLYDVTNAVLIQPSNYKFFSSSTTLTDRFVGQFQTASNSTSYRLIFHIGTTDTDAMTLKIDNISVSPQGTTLAPIVTDWKSYTPTITTSTGSMTNYTASALYSRNGDSINISGTISFSGAVGTWTNPSFSLPAGLSVDEDKIANQYLQIVGSVTFLDFGVTTYKGVVRYAKPSNTLEIMYLATVTNDAGSVTDPAFYTGARSTAPFSMASGDEISFTVSNLPILGWSSGLEIGDNYSGREIAARATLATDQTGVNTNGSSVKVNFNSVSANGGFDTIGAYDTSAYRYNVKTSGKYIVNGSIILAATNVLNNRYIVTVYKNGSAHTRGMEITPQASSYVTFPFVATIDAVAGDYFEVYFYGAGNNSASTLTFEALSSINVSKLSSPAAIASGEKVAARYSTTAATATTNATLIPFDTKDYDTHGAVTTGASWKFTAPTRGVYTVNAMFDTTAAANTVGEYLGYLLYKNGSSTGKYVALMYVQTTSSISYSAKGSVDVELSAGDYIDIRTAEAVTNVPSLSGTAGLNYIEIKKQ